VLENGIVALRWVMSTEQCPIVVAIFDELQGELELRMKLDCENVHLLGVMMEHQHYWGSRMAEGHEWHRVGIHSDHHWTWMTSLWW